MEHIRSMLESTPAQTTMPVDELQECIRACFDCAQACVGCADACLHEDGVAQLRRCIVVDTACADICVMTGRVLSGSARSQDAWWRSVVEACRAACDACAQECEQHAEHHEHCRICADACRACEAACSSLLSA